MSEETAVEIPIDEPLDTRANPSRLENPDELEVKVEPKPRKPDELEVKVEPKPRKIVQPDEGLDALKAQLSAEQRDKEAERVRRQAAETRAANAESTATSAQREVADTRLHLVTANITSITQTLDAAEAALAAAHAAGDAGAVAKLNRQLAVESAKLAQMEWTKHQIENAPPPRPVVSDPVEKLASTMAPESAAWIRAHPDYAAGAKYQEMVAAHQMALARGHSANTPGYFQFIERKLDMETPEVRTTSGNAEIEIDTAPQKATGGRSAPAAPVSRGGSGNGSRPRTVTLSPAQREAARISGMTDREYALSLLAIEEDKAAGRIN